MLSPSFLLKKNFKIIILVLIVTLVFCLIYPYKQFKSISLIESMVGNNESNTTKSSPTSTTSTTSNSNTAANQQTGINVPIPSFNVPSGLKLNDPTPAVVQPAKESCPPCPPCARCPEPSFECKKVPKYRNLLINDKNQMVSPMVADYTTFGM